MNGNRPNRADREALAPSTLAVLAGRPNQPGSPLSTPPVFASAYRSGGDQAYAREGNPSWAALEEATAALEGAASAVSFSSGMAASTAILETLPNGARVLAASSAYVELRRVLAERAASGRIELTYADVADAAGFADAAAGHDLVWVDAISNPDLAVARLDTIAAATRRAGALLVVDSTLATPVLLRPLSLGADAVVHSATKYIGGHSDLLLGIVATAEVELTERLRSVRDSLGATPGTMEAWLALRGLRTLVLRVERGQETAGILAERLAAHPAVSRVRYPGLPDDPSYGVASELLDGFGAMVSFEVGGRAEADRVCDGVEVITHAGSLGGVETLIERHARWHAEPSIPEGLLRLSVGCEDVEDLWRDLERALAAAVPLRAVAASPAAG